MTGVVVDPQLVSDLSDADAHAWEEHRGLPMLRETVLVWPDKAGGTPVLVLL